MMRALLVFLRSIGLLGRNCEDLTHLPTDAPPRYRRLSLRFPRRCAAPSVYRHPAKRGDFLPRVLGPPEHLYLVSPKQPDHPFPSPESE